MLNKSVRRGNPTQLVLALIGVVLLIVFGSMVRIYYGANVGLRVVAKGSPSLTDTIVNLDDILGQPRIVVSTQHPAVKRQLEEMGFIESDEQFENRKKRELDVEIQQKTREIEEQTRRQMETIQRQLRY